LLPFGVTKDIGTVELIISSEIKVLRLFVTRKGGKPSVTCWDRPFGLVDRSRAPRKPSCVSNRVPFDRTAQGINAALDGRQVAHSGGGGHMGDMTTDDGRLGRLENEVHAIKGSLDWAKVAFAILATVTLGGMGILISLDMNLSAKVGGISDKIAEEFRAQRLEQAAQVSAISNAITATKQQPPQVILVPAPCCN
jgi:hypothetical protein